MHVDHNMKKCWGSEMENYKRDTLHSKNKIDKTKKISEKTENYEGNNFMVFISLLPFSLFMMIVFFAFVYSLWFLILYIARCSHSIVSFVLIFRFYGFLLVSCILSVVIN
jgi:hypothetical protein